jgi:hypothetical protein
VGEHDRALGLDRLAEHDAVDAGDQPRKLVAPLLNPAPTETLAVEVRRSEVTKQAGAAPALGRMAARIRSQARIALASLATTRRLHISRNCAANSPEASEEMLSWLRLRRERTEPSIGPCHKLDVARSWRVDVLEHVFTLRLRL